MTQRRSEVVGVHLLVLLLVEIIHVIIGTHAEGHETEHRPEQVSASRNCGQPVEIGHVCWWMAATSCCSGAAMRSSTSSSRACTGPCTSSRPASTRWIHTSGDCVYHVHHPVLCLRSCRCSWQRLQTGHSGGHKGKSTDLRSATKHYWDCYSRTGRRASLT